MEQNINNIEKLKEIIAKNSKFRIKVAANSKNNSIDFTDELIKIKITVPPIEGRANKAVIEFLSKTLKIPKSRIRIISGEKSSIKTIQVMM